MPQLSSRAISDQTVPVHGVAPVLHNAQTRVIAGYKLQRAEISSPEGRKLKGLGRRHVELATYLDEHKGTWFTCAELMQVTDIRSDAYLSTCMGQLPKRFNISYKKDEQTGVRSWVMNEPQIGIPMAESQEPVVTANRIALDPAGQYLLQESPRALWIEGIEKPLTERQFHVLQKLHEAGNTGLSAQELANACRFSIACTYQVIDKLRDIVPPGTIVNKKNPLGGPRQYRLQWHWTAQRPAPSEKPAPLPAPPHLHLQLSIVAAAEEMKNQSYTLVNTAADDIQKALTDCRWDRLNERIRALSKEIEEFLLLQKDDHGKSMRASVSPSAQMLVNAMSSHDDPVVMAHMKAGCQYFGEGRYPLPLIRLLRCIPLKKSKSEVVASHQAALLTPDRRARTLQAVLVYLSWLQIPWSNMSDGSIAELSSDIDEEIQRLFAVLRDAHDAAQSDQKECAAIVSSLKGALLPEYCALPLAQKLRHAKSQPGSLISTLQAALITLEGNAHRHRGPAHSLHPFETRSFQNEKDVKRKRDGADHEHANKKARTSDDIEPTSIPATFLNGHFGSPMLLDGVSVASLLGMTSGSEVVMPTNMPPHPSPQQSFLHVHQRQQHPSAHIRASYTSRELVSGNFSAVPAPQWVRQPPPPIATSNSSSAATRSKTLGISVASLLGIASDAGPRMPMNAVPSAPFSRPGQFQGFPNAYTPTSYTCAQLLSSTFSIGPMCQGNELTIPSSNTNTNTNTNAGTPTTNAATESHDADALEREEPDELAGPWTDQYLGDDNW
ncbi:hypothetical protein F9K07_13485 [Hydrogenophaga sp. BPS33]|nr:hypothetical protein F9K07_13485 [Hydrogenophaga sp. BPS33]